MSINYVPNSRRKRGAMGRRLCWNQRAYVISSRSSRRKVNNVCPIRTHAFNKINSTCNICRCNYRDSYNAAETGFSIDRTPQSAILLVCHIGSAADLTASRLDLIRSRYDVLFHGLRASSTALLDLYARPGYVHDVLGFLFLSRLRIRTCIIVVSWMSRSSKGRYTLHIAYVWSSTSHSVLDKLIPSVDVLGVLI